MYTTFKHNIPQKIVPLEEQKLPSKNFTMCTSEVYKVQNCTYAGFCPAKVQLRYGKSYDSYGTPKFQAMVMFTLQLCCSAKCVVFAHGSVMKNAFYNSGSL